MTWKVGFRPPPRRLTSGGVDSIRRGVRCIQWRRADCVTMRTLGRVVWECACFLAKTLARLVWGCACFLTKTTALLAASAVTWGGLACLLFSNPSADGSRTANVFAMIILGALGVSFVMFVIEAVSGDGVAKSLLAAMQLFCTAPFFIAAVHVGVSVWQEYRDAHPGRRPSVGVAPHDDSVGQSHEGIDAAETLMDSWRGR